MKSKFYKVAVLLLLVALVCLVFVFGWARYVQYASHRALLSVRQHEHKITAIEVFRISESSKIGPAGSYWLPYDHSLYAVTASHLLTGAQASELVRTWEQVKFTNSYMALCHNPGFVLRFLAGTHTVFEVAVCFDCENISYACAPFSSDIIQMIPTKFDGKSGMDDLKTFLVHLQ